jgi:hypothetical protein
MAAIIPQKKTYDRILAEGLGLKGQSHDKVAGGATTTTGSQRVYYRAVPLRAGDVVSSATVLVDTAAASATLAKVGLYDAAGARLAISSDFSSSLSGTGFITGTFTAAYTVPTDGLYYLAFLNVAGTGAAIWVASIGSNSKITAAIGASPKHTGQQDSQVDLPATATIAGSGVAIWIGWA